ncbi:amidoligase family protein [Tessaracoccus sp.]
MVCRSTPVNSAATSFARLATGVHDVQVLSMFHELRRDAQRSAVGTAGPTGPSYDAYLVGTRERVMDTSTLTPARRDAIVARLNQAREQLRVSGTRPDGPTFYALQEIEVRSSRASQELDAHFALLATQHNTSVETVRARFNQLVTDNQAAGRSGPAAPEHLPFGRSHLPGDRSTLYALSVLHQVGPALAGTPRGLARAELYARAESDRIANGPTSNCPDCGQFQGDHHTCPNPVVSDAALADLREQLTGTRTAHVGPSAADMATWPHANDEDDLERADAAGDQPEPTYEFCTRHGGPWGHDTTCEQCTDGNGEERPLTRTGNTNTEHDASRSRIRAARASSRQEPALPTCDRCGGPWGNDPTCTQCTGAGGVPRDYPDAEGVPRVPWLDAANARFRAPAGPSPATPATTAPTPAAPVRIRTATRSYDQPNSTVRMTNLTTLRTALRAQAGTPREEHVQVALTVPAPNSNNPGANTIYRVTGNVLLTDTGQRQTRTHDRYTATPPEPDYTGNVRTLRCTCPAYRTYYRCEHLQMAATQVAARLSGQDVATIPASTINNVRDGLTTDYQNSVAAAATARAGWVPESTYVNSMEAFQTSWDQARVRADAGDTLVPYMTEDVTGGLGSRTTGRSFGIEIEIDFPDDTTYEAKNRVAQEIFDAGLSQAPVVRGWHWSGRGNDSRGRSMGGGYSDAPNRWAVEFDRSVDDVGGQRGCEVVSPILYDEPQTWANLSKICEIVERNGGRATPRTGLHINVGAADFNHTVGNHNRLLRLSEAYEDVLIRLSHNPASGPNHRGRSYCGANVIPAEGYRRIRDAQLSNSHRSMINLDHVPAEGNPITNSTRVEIRAFDGTTDVGRIQTSVKLGLGLVAAAVRGEDIAQEPERAGTHLAANPRRARRTGEAWREDTASFRRFADQIFSRDKDKNQLVSMFAASRWQRN